jgi:hypothetical protein
VRGPGPAVLPPAARAGWRLPGATGWRRRAAGCANGGQPGRHCHPAPAGFPALPRSRRRVRLHGAVADLLDDIREMGFEVFNPVQPGVPGHLPEDIPFYPQFKNGKRSLFSFLLERFSLYGFP